MYLSELLAKSGRVNLFLNALCEETPSKLYQGLKTKLKFAFSEYRCELLAKNINDNLDLDISTTQIQSDIGVSGVTIYYGSGTHTYCFINREVSLAEKILDNPESYKGYQLNEVRSYLDLNSRSEKLNQSEWRLLTSYLRPLYGERFSLLGEQFENKLYRECIARHLGYSSLRKSEINYNGKVHSDLEKLFFKFDASSPVENLRKARFDYKKTLTDIGVE